MEQVTNLDTGFAGIDLPADQEIDDEQADESDEAPEQAAEADTSGGSTEERLVAEAAAEDEAANAAGARPAVLVPPSGTPTGTPPAQAKERKRVDLQRRALKAAGLTGEMLEKALAIKVTHSSNGQRVAPISYMVTDLPMVTYFESRSDSDIRADMAKLVRRDGGQQGPDGRCYSLLLRGMDPAGGMRAKKVKADATIEAELVELVAKAFEVGGAEAVTKVVLDGLTRGRANIAHHEEARMTSIRRMYVAYSNELVRRQLVSDGKDPAKFDGYLALPQ